MKSGRETCLGKIDEARPQSHRESYIRRIASLTSRYWSNGRFRLSIPTVSVRVSLPLRSRNRIPVEYTTSYSSIPRSPSTPSLLPTRFPRKPHQPPPRRIHLHLPPFPVATTTDLAKRARCQFARCQCAYSRCILISAYVFCAPFCWSISLEVTISYFKRLPFMRCNKSISYIYYRLLSINQRLTFQQITLYLVITIKKLLNLSVGTSRACGILRKWKYLFIEIRI